MKKEKLDILYEDKFLIIVNKKSGILTIANDKEKEKTSSLDDLLNDSDLDKDDNMLEDYIMNNNKENAETKDEDEDLTQSDLFNLIDSMYEKGEDK